MTDQNTSEPQISEQRSEEQELVARLNSETAAIDWHDLQTHYAAGNVLGISAKADLIKVAIEFNRDNATQIQQRRIAAYLKSATNRQQSGTKKTNSSGRWLSRPLCLFSKSRTEWSVTM